MRALGLMFAALLLLGACTFDPPGGGRPPDGGLVADAGEGLDVVLGPDAAPTDAAPLDLGGPEDAGAPEDAGPPDLGAPDAEPVDAGAPDAGEGPDAGPGAVCGDGRVEGAELCDDANQTAGDGCTQCGVDLGYVCALQPSFCVLIADSAVVDGAHPDCADEEDEGDEGPWCTLGLALGADPAPVLVLVRTATYTESLVLDAAPPVTLVAPAGAVWTSDMGPALNVKGGSEVVLSGFIIRGTGAGGGVKVENRGSLLTLLDNHIGPADARGVDARGDGVVVMRRNVVQGNLQGGLYLDSNSGYDVANNVIVRNGAVANDMGGVRIKKTDATARFVNNSIANNTSNGEPAGIRCDVDTEVTNVVVWGNTGDGMAEVSTRCGPRYSVLQAMLPGPGNRADDPRFVNDRLETGAGASTLDSGDPAGVEPAGPAPAEDFARRPRPVGAAVDIGAHESP